MSHTYESLRALRPLSVGEETISLRSVLTRFSEGDPHGVVCPDYQRGHVWTNPQASRFMGFLLAWGKVPPIFVQRWPDYSSKMDEIVDGKQRTTAIIRWMKGEIPAEFADGTSMFIGDFSDSDRRSLTGHGGPCLTIQYVGYKTRLDVMAFYLRLNSGGTPHDETALDRVRQLILSEGAPQ